MSLIWAADLSKTNSNLAGFQDADWNRITPSGNGAASGLPWPMPVDLAPDGVRSTQCYLPSGGRRNEVLPDIPDLTGGENWYFCQQFYMPDGFDTLANKGSQYQVIEQMRQEDDTGSPVAAFEVRNNNLLLTGGYDINNAGATYSYSQTLAPVATGHRYALIYRMGPFSTTPASTTIDVWLDDTQVLGGYTIPPATVIGGGTYRKCGLYRDAANTIAETMWQSGHAIGTTYADVAPVPPAPATTPVTTAALRAGSFYLAGT